ncbi:MAG: DUF4013 domain-containing protein [Candidatus Nanoarchaeia archaeon]
MSLAAIKRPFSARVLPGLLLVLFPIIEFFAMGYKLVCARTAMSFDYKLPPWKAWKELFVFGAVARVIQALWLTPAIVTLIVLWLKLKSFNAAALQSTTTTILQQFLAIRNLFAILIALLIIAAIFAPASILNYVTEGHFSAAFSFSMLKRMFSFRYLIGLLVAGAYVIFVLGLSFSLFYFVGRALQAQSPFLIATFVLPVEAILLWLPFVTIWTLLGEAWGKVLQKEYVV